MSQVRFPGTRSSQGWATLEPGVWGIQGPHWHGRLLPLSVLAGREPGWEQSKWDLGQCFNGGAAGQGAAQPAAHSACLSKRLLLPFSHLSENGIGTERLCWDINATFSFAADSQCAERVNECGPRLASSSQSRGQRGAGFLRHLRRSSTWGRDSSNSRGVDETGHGMPPGMHRAHEQRQSGAGTRGHHPCTFGRWAIPWHLVGSPGVGGRMCGTSPEGEIAGVGGSPDCTPGKSGFLLRKCDYPGVPDACLMGGALVPGSSHRDSSLPWVQGVSLGLVLRFD